MGQLVSPHASSEHSIKYLKPKSFEENLNFEIQLLSPVCSLPLCYYTFIISACVSASDRKDKIVLYHKNLTESVWVDLEHRTEAHSKYQSIKALQYVET